MQNGINRRMLNVLFKSTDYKNCLVLKKRGFARTKLSHFYVVFYGSKVNIILFIVLFLVSKRL